MKKQFLFIALLFNLLYGFGQVNFPSKTAYQHKDIFMFNGKTYMLGSPDMANARNRMYDLLKTFELFEIDPATKSVEKFDIDIKPLAKDFSQYNFKYYRKGKYLIFEYNLLSYSRLSQLCRVYYYDLEKKELKTIDIPQNKKTENKIYSIDIAQNGEETMYIFVNRSKFTDNFMGSMSCDFDIIKHNLNNDENEVTGVSFNEKFSINYIQMLKEGFLFLALYSSDTKNFWAIYDIENQNVVPVSFDLKNSFYSSYYVTKIGENWYFEIKTGTEYKITDTEIFDISGYDGSSKKIEENEDDYQLVLNNKRNTTGNDENLFYDLVSEDTKIIYTHFNNGNYITQEIELGIKTTITSASGWDYNNETKYYISNNELHIYSNNSSDVGGKIYTLVVDLVAGEVKEKNVLKGKLKINKTPYSYIDAKGNVGAVFVEYDKKLKANVFSFETNEF
jgi:hypothetical protein